MNKFFSVILFVVCLGVKAQDIHFTQWMHAPQTYSPSTIGDFDGKYRFHGNYRNQWSSVTVPFVTFATMAESNSIKSIPGLGIKAGFVYDITGDSKFSTTHLDLGAGYTIPMNDSLYGISDATNALKITSSILGDTTIVGAGAGKIETGFALYNDIISIVNG